MKKILAIIKKKYQAQQAKTKDVDLRRIWSNPLYFIASGFGAGLLPSPGTFGTLVGVLIYLLIHTQSLPIYVAIVLALNIAGVFLCAKMNTDFGTDDHPAAAWDEVAAFPIVMIAVPFTWYFIVLGFVLFRFFDIVKPEPIGWIDRHVHGGVGVMLDDIVAAVICLGILQLIAFAQPLL